MDDRANNNRQQLYPQPTQYQEKTRNDQYRRDDSPSMEAVSTYKQDGGHYPLRERRTSPKPPLRDQSPKPLRTYEAPLSDMHRKVSDQKRYSYVNTEGGSFMTGEGGETPTAQNTQEMLLRDSNMRGYERLVKDYRGTSPLRSENSKSPARQEVKQNKPERLSREEIETVEKLTNKYDQKAIRPREASNEELSDWVLQRMTGNGSRRVR